MRTGAAAEICARRLAAQFLTTRGPAKPGEVVRALGAVQAQDFAGAKWALSMRARHATDAAIEREFAAGRILRTHVLRPTWHFVMPEDIRWMLALTGPRVSRAMASYNRKMELTRPVFRRAERILEKELRDGNCLTRAEIRAHFERARLDVTGMNRLAHIMMEAELNGVVCSGPRSGKQFTYALLDERAPATRALDRDDALGRLASTYFTTRGPATARDFAWWSGLIAADGRRGIEVATSSLESRTIDDQRYWHGRGTPPKGSPASVFLLPNYDEYFIGYRDRGAIGKRLASVDLVTGGSTLIAHVIVVNGQLVGGWKRVGQGTKTIVDATLLVPLTRQEREGLDSAVDTLSVHLDRPVRLTLRNHGRIKA